MNALRTRVPSLPLTSVALGSQMCVSPSYLRLMSTATANRASSASDNEGYAPVVCSSSSYGYSHDSAGGQSSHSESWSDAVRRLARTLLGGGSGALLAFTLFGAGDSGSTLPKGEASGSPTGVEKVFTRATNPSKTPNLRRVQDMSHAYTQQQAKDYIRAVLEKERGEHADMWPRVRASDDKNSIEYSIEGGYDCTEIVRMLLAALGPEGTSAQVSTDENGWLYFSTHTGFSAGLYRDELTNTTRVWFEQKNSVWRASELAAILETYMQGNGKLRHALTELHQLGLHIYTPDDGITWDYLAGAEDIKDEIYSGVILPLQHPELYDNVCRITRKQVLTTNRPKAILFDGPPGTGKTTTARIIASQVKVPLVYVPVESIMNKFYGESEKILGSIFDACDKIGNAIIFIDEIDSLATSRGDNMHEATRRILSVLLRKIEGFEQGGKTIVIGATNRKQDLDPAMLSRFDMTLHFDRPTDPSRVLIFGNYAKHLNQGELRSLAKHTAGFSGRDIRDVCAHAERNWAAQLIKRGDVDLEATPPPPPPSEYMRSINLRKQHLSNPVVQ